MPLKVLVTAVCERECRDEELCLEFRDAEGGFLLSWDDMEGKIIERIEPVLPDAEDQSDTVRIILVDREVWDYD